MNTLDNRFYHKVAVSSREKYDLSSLQIDYPK